MLKIMVLVYSYIVIQMLFVWILSRLLKNPSIVDLAWVIILMISGLMYLGIQPHHSRLIVIGLLLFLWGIRLTSYLWLTRVSKGMVDKRYSQLEDAWNSASAMRHLFNCQLQGIFIFVISSVFFFASYETTNTFSRWDYAACVLVVISILGEALADMQLHHFKKHNPGKVCNIGFWYHSRHPNYFFEWLIWCGFALFGLQNPDGWMGFLSPILLYIIMTEITGPVTERGSAESRGQLYLSYQETTAMFFPWFKKV
ncbi:MAG: DUF1295 domain-containing protein [Gammaproteobacteria bacterium]